VRRASWFPSSPVAVAVDDDLVGVVCEPIECALGQDWIFKERNPFVDGSIGCEDGGGSSMSLEDELVEVAGLLRIEFAQSEVIEDEDIWRE
jgi:hypothetical protein